MKQIILNVSEGVKKIDIRPIGCDNMSRVQLTLDALVGDPTILDIDCSGKIELRKITPSEFADQMGKIAHECERDSEVAHLRADRLMCRVLREQGFTVGVDEFERVPKHYV